MITKEDINRFTFSEYKKISTTKLSDQTVPEGTVVMTLEGEWVCAEPSRIAIDNAGNIYPIAESIRITTYELV